jgi:molybdopterin molybdotransferase
MQEHALRRDGAILIDRRPRPGQNIRRRGEDLPFGAPILEAGRLILAREAAAAAATGAAEVAVRRRVRIAFFCSGSELAPPGTPLGPGQIYNSNRFGLIGALAQNWIDATDLGAVPDDPEALGRALATAATADLVVSTGGVSVGDADHLPRLVREAGGRLTVLKIAMKPGKPLTLGRLGRAVWLGLPGNPVAAHVGWTLIGARIAERLAGLAAPLRPKSVVKAGFTLDRDPGRCEFRPARITGHDATGAPVAMILPGSFSARIAELAASDGLVAIPADDTAIRPGHLLEFLPF